MPPSKTDTYRVILLKILKDSLSDANPLTQKQKNKRQTQKPKPYIPIKIQTDYNLQFSAATPYAHKSD